MEEAKDRRAGGGQGRRGGGLRSAAECSRRVGEAAMCIRRMTRTNTSGGRRGRRCVRSGTGPRSIRLRMLRTRAPNNRSRSFWIRRIFTRKWAGRSVIPANFAPTPVPSSLWKPRARSGHYVLHIGHVKTWSTHRRRFAHRRGHGWPGTYRKKSHFDASRELGVARNARRSRAAERFAGRSGKTAF